MFLFFDYPINFAISFQDPATITAEGLINLHHDIMFYLVFIIIFVISFLYEILLFFLKRESFWALELKKKIFKNNKISYKKIDFKLTHIRFFRIFVRIYNRIIHIINWWDCRVNPRFYMRPRFFKIPSIKNRLVKKAPFRIDVYRTRVINIDWEFIILMFLYIFSLVAMIIHFSFLFTLVINLIFYFILYFFQIDHFNTFFLKLYTAVYHNIYYAFFKKTRDKQLNLANFSMHNKINKDEINHHSDLEVIWTLIPTVILCFIAFPSIKLLYAVDEAVFCPLTVKVIGHQWYWSYEYGKNVNIDSSISSVSQNVVTFDSYMIPYDNLELGNVRLLSCDNSLILPVWINIRLLITSEDVLHSWAVPSLGVKIDAVPGRINQNFIYIKRPGLFFGQCSEICGTNHGFMPINVNACYPDVYAFWYLHMISQTSDSIYKFSENLMINN